MIESQRWGAEGEFSNPVGVEHPWPKLSVTHVRLFGEQGDVQDNMRPDAVEHGGLNCVICPALLSVKYRIVGHRLREQVQESLQKEDFQYRGCSFIIISVTFNNCFVVFLPLPPLTLIRSGSSNRAPTYRPSACLLAAVAALAREGHR